MPSRPLSSQTKDTEDNVVDPNPACNTLIHWSDPVVDVASVRIVMETIPLNTLTLQYILRLKVYCICETLSCETACTTSTPGPVDWEEEQIFRLGDYMGAAELAELKKQWKEGKFDQTTGGQTNLPGTLGLSDLIEAGFVSNDYVDNPDNAQDWWSPVTDSTNRYYGKYIRPNGTMEGWNFLFGMTKPCTCQRVVTHTNQVSDRTNVTSDLVFD